MTAGDDTDDQQPQRPSAKAVSSPGKGSTQTAAITGLPAHGVPERKLRMAFAPFSALFTADDLPAHLSSPVPCPGNGPPTPWAAQRDPTTTTPLCATTKCPRGTFQPGAKSP